MGWRVLLPFLKHIVPLPTLVRLVAARPSGLDETRRPRLAAIHQLLDAGRLVVSGNCLERSLVMYRFLAQAGARPQLVMGVSTSTAGVKGHTWVELNGEPLLDSTTRRFSPIMIFGPEGRVRPVAD